MVKQFLLNPDGSIPEGVNLQMLEAAGIPLVMPTPMPRTLGMVAVERDPVQIDGVWFQMWDEQPAPKADGTQE